MQLLLRMYKLKVALSRDILCIEIALNSILHKPIKHYAYHKLIGYLGLTKGSLPILFRNI